MRYLIGTTFYTSLILQKAPGTVTSLAMFIILWLLNPLAIEIKVCFIIIFIVSHFFCFPYFEKRFGKDDPALYTLDEASAMLLLNIPFHEIYQWGAAFLVFRFFDIVKPLWIKTIERKKQIPSNIRNLGDDLVAALYTFVVIWCVDYVF